VHVYLTYPFVLSWSLLEAMSAGCAIVASDTPPVREVISSGLNGLLVNFFDREALASRVIELLSNPEHRRVLGANARELVIKNYDLKSVCLPQQLSWVSRLATSGV
jgi:glycosyltransferase involved in cell wall biosynthesis